MYIREHMVQQGGHQHFEAEMHLFGLLCYTKKLKVLRHILVDYILKIIWIKYCSKTEDQLKSALSGRIRQTLELPNQSLMSWNLGGDQADFVPFVPKCCVSNVINAFSHSSVTNNIKRYDFFYHNYNITQNF